jgi:TonB family protein
MSESGQRAATSQATTAEITGPGLRAPSAAMTSWAVRRTRQKRRFLLMLVVSLLLHLSAFAAWAFFPRPQRRAVDLDEAVVKTRLVKLGKPRDEKLLPRLPSSPPPPPPEQKAPPKLEPEKPATPDATKPAEKVSAADILDRFRSDNTTKSLNDVIKNKIGDDDEEGQEHGDAEGTALEGEVTESYFARVTARIRGSMEVSSVLTDEERIRLKAVLCLQIGEDGTVSNLSVKTSGSTLFDADVTAAARRASPLPAPPPPARARAQSGVCFNFCPTRCN